MFPLVLNKPRATLITWLINAGLLCLCIYCKGSFFLCGWLLDNQRNLGFVQPRHNSLGLVRWSTTMFLHKMSFGTAVREGTLCWMDPGPSNYTFILMSSNKGQRVSRDLGQTHVGLTIKSRINDVCLSQSCILTPELLRTSLRCLIYVFKIRKSVNG